VTIPGGIPKLGTHVTVMDLAIFEIAKEKLRSGFTRKWDDTYYYEVSSLQRITAGVVPPRIMS
jgi:hypothetical protein